jgi:lysozyme
MSPPMRISASGLAFIADEEGFVATVYHDVAGVPTIGFGHVMRPGDPTVVSRDEAMVILKHDVATAESAVNHDVKLNLLQPEFDALVSFTFNLGSGALASSGLLTHLNDGDTLAAAREFPKWCHARVNGELIIVDGLFHRRIREAAMFLGMSVADARVVLGLDPKSKADPTAIAVADAPPVSPEIGQPTPPGDLPPADDA